MVVWTSLRHERPEPWRVIEFFEVAKFVNDEVVGEVRGEKQNAVVEVEITAL